ncbi:hypothetical protein EDC01DRAFT_747097 [Geopyxis carbonaria]|nr:hypothetical protein EDC01DRAFT_747097 [Geopyxis carbonaria]
MASYEDDHNLRPTAATRTQLRPRLDLSEFHASLNSPADGQEAPHDNENVFRTLARAYQDLTQTPLLQSLIHTLVDEAQNDTKSKGVPDGFLDSLERVDKKLLKKPQSKLMPSKDDICCICNTAFLEDATPLVVRLPCHPDHIFDLECIQPWLELHTTCPLDRDDLVKKKVLVPLLEQDDSEEEYDDMYG